MVYYILSASPLSLYICAKSFQSCLTLCDPVDCNLPGTSEHGILQARILEWVAMPSSRGSSQSRDRTQVSYIAGRFFTVWATRKAQLLGQPTADGLKGMLVPSSLGLILNVWNKDCPSTYPIPIIPPYVRTYTHTHTHTHIHTRVKKTYRNWQNTNSRVW